ncbi:unnamed protein product [Fusarium venenatum]|uniref:Uncharacterized protein n=1 Tax=Fusarium venenatum TaxID=56646 RepID=A0A2L2TJV6_9HYPO|nr:uncharacterized protein FVRRES_01239 [Fusarium venenatum]CEI64727.1 unnamed protein product [Fusarium venenatum]
MLSTAGFVDGVFTGWASRLDALKHPVLRKRWLLETHTAVGKLIRYTPSETNGLARRAGAHVFLGITLNYE